MKKGILPALGIFVLSSQCAWGWSSAASKTQMDLQVLSVAIVEYKAQFGSPPAPENYWVRLAEANLWQPRKAGIPVDRWGRRFVYRVPGRYRPFEIYSVGEDGIDQHGERDDVSSYGVKEGYHWKKTWAVGRWFLAFGFLSGAVTLFLGCLFRSTTVAPLLGCIPWLAAAIGFRLLRHPGIVPDRNWRLDLEAGIALSFACGLFYIGIRNLNRCRGASNKAAEDCDGAAPSAAEG